MSYSIACTQPLLKILACKEPGAPMPIPSTMLGNWHASVVETPSGRLILCCSGQSFLPAFIRASEASNPDRLGLALQTEVTRLLEALEIPEWFVAHEIVEMAAPTVSTTSSRQVLGVMNDYRSQLSMSSFTIGDADRLRLALHFAQSPLTPLNMESPIQTTRLLASSTSSSIH